MTGKIFVDTNVLVYAYDRTAAEVQEIARTELRELWESRRGRLSTQVLTEFFMFLTKAITKPIPAREAREIIRPYTHWVESSAGGQTAVRASEIAELWAIPFWDAMVVASAEEVGARQLLTGAAVAGRTIAGIEIINPFSEVLELMNDVSIRAATAGERN
jgi:predicted nucleic acid-binding protein